MTALTKAQAALRRAAVGEGRDSPLSRRDPRATTLTALAYVAAVLSAGAALPTLLLLAALPVAACAAAAVSYRRVALRSLAVLPLAALMGAANPLLHREPALWLGATPISRGWVELTAIAVRAVLSAQMAIVLIEATGFRRICQGLRQLGMPALMATQLLMVYRYVGVLVDEALAMERGRASRGHCRRGNSPRQWAAMVGQLLLRAAERARRVHQAMLARRFNGVMPAPGRHAGRWQRADTRLLLTGLAAIAACRLANPTAMFH